MAGMGIARWRYYCGGIMRTPSTGNATRPDDENAQAADGNADARADSGKARSSTLPDVHGRPAPRLPHERDESSDSGTGAPSEVMRRAHDDVASGKTGTDKGEATDAAYRRNLRGATPGPERD
jgi:hypothetical protein